MKVLIATDGTPWSEDAIREAARLVPLTDAEVHVVSVASLMSFIVGYEPTAAAAAMVIDREIAAAHLDAGKAVKLLETLGVKATAHDREGDPVREILALGEEIGADLLVVGAHGKSAFERFMLGSTSDGIAHRWHGALLILRPKAA